MKESLLQKFGLDEKSAKVYIFCSHSPSTTPTNIAHQLQMPRSTVCFCLERLQQRNLIGYRIVGKRKQVLILSPKKPFLEYIRLQKKQVQEREKDLKNILKQAFNIPKENSQTSKVSSFEGKAGVFYVIEKILSEKKDIFWIGLLSPIISTIGEESLYKMLTLQRLKQNTKSYAITTKDILQNKKIGEELGQFRNYAFLNEGILPEGCVLICGSFVAFFMKKSKKARILVIEDKYLSQMVFSIFKILWKEKVESSPLLENKNGFKNLISPF